ncbi:MAG: AMP nucleosidase [Planctomycetales bacterium]|nr:AMP nucleosidase [Planctomycetales bacterium]
MAERLRIQGSDAGRLVAAIDAACDWMEAVYAAGNYAKVTVFRKWSTHNPIISGKMARPAAYRWYLRRELLRLAQRGAEIEITRAQPRVDWNSPRLLEIIDETDFDHTLKKAFLFGPERAELSIARLEHYTATQVEHFQRYVLLTNYQMHIDAFRDMFPQCLSPSRDGAQMPAYHHCAADNAGITIVNIGVGPSNAKTLTDHIAVLRPDALLMVGHCAGIRNHQEIGDFVLASGYMRDDHVLDQALPRSVPIAPSFLLNRYLAKILDTRQLPYRYGAVYTTANRNWELTLTNTLKDLKSSRSIAVDMESATVAANGFRYRIPCATLLCVSDKPLHGNPKLPQAAKTFYDKSKIQHLEIACAAMDMARSEYPDGLPNSDLRAMDEPLLGGPET